MFVIKGITKVKMAKTAAELLLENWWWWCTICDFHNFGLIFAGQCTVCLKG